LPNTPPNSSMSSMFSGWLVDLEPKQAEFLDRVCAGPLISVEDLRLAGALEVPNKSEGGAHKPTGPDLFSADDS
jgi:hypothetical protein